MEDQNVESLRSYDSEPTIRCIYFKDADTDRWTLKRLEALELPVEERAA